MADPVSVLRTSHDRFAGLVSGLDADAVTGPSYDDEWTIADVASHLGSQAEIFGAFLDAGLAGEEPPSNEAFPPIWDRWNATAPAEQVSNSVAANEAFVTRVEGLPADEYGAFRATVFGMDLDLDALVTMRLGEHAVHTWDVAVALDPASTVAADAVPLLLDQLKALAGRAQKPVEGGQVVRVRTTDPDSSWTFDLAAGGQTEAKPAAEVALPAEAFVRLVYGRLDADHTPSDLEADPAVLDGLRAAFPGF